MFIRRMELIWEVGFCNDLYRKIDIQHYIYTAVKLHTQFFRASVRQPFSMKSTSIQMHNSTMYSHSAYTVIYPYHKTAVPLCIITVQQSTSTSLPNSFTVIQINSLTAALLLHRYSALQPNSYTISLPMFKCKYACLMS